MAITLKGIEIIVGWKPFIETPIPTLIRSGQQISFHEAMDFYRSMSQPPTTSLAPIESNANLVNDFLEIVDFGSFKAFVKQYGLIILAGQFEDFRDKLMSSMEYPSDAAAVTTWDAEEWLQGKKITNHEDLLKYFSLISVVLGNVLQEIWQGNKGHVLEWQGELRTLLAQICGTEASSSVSFRKAINGIRLTPFVIPSGEGVYRLVLSTWGILDSCYLVIALSNTRVAKCNRQSCNNLFLLTTHNRQYCSKNCREVSKRERGGPLEVKKNQLRSRLSRAETRRPRAIDRETADEARWAISEVTTMKALKTVEKEYGLQPKAKGRPKKATAKKPAGKKAAKGGAK